MQFRNLWRWFAAFLTVLMVSVLLLSLPEVAFASIHRYPEAGDRVMWRSLQTLRDEQDQAWQVVFYKRLNAGQADCLNLRLVGFPGSAELARSQPLNVSTRSGQAWSVAIASDVPLPQTAGEYDFRNVISELRGSPAIELNLPIQNRSLKLIVPPFVVQEWQAVMQEIGQKDS